MKLRLTSDMSLSGLHSLGKAKTTSSHTHIKHRSTKETQHLSCKCSVFKCLCVCVCVCVSECVTCRGMAILRGGSWRRGAGAGLGLGLLCSCSSGTVLCVPLR